jgi:hypothetical protein
MWTGALSRPQKVVMLALVASIHDFFYSLADRVAPKKSWMVGTRPTMTIQ